jgi:hypothetical protein
MCSFLSPYNVVNAICGAIELFGLRTGVELIGRRAGIRFGNTTITTVHLKGNVLKQTLGIIAVD